MEYRYRNRKTGEIVTTTNKVSGKNWEPVEETPAMIPEEETAESPASEEEAVEHPAEKPAAKSTRKGKK